MKAVMDRKLVSKVKIIIFVLMLIGVSSAEAEYYVVVSGPATFCSCHRAHHYQPYHHRSYHHRPYHHRSHYQSCYKTHHVSYRSVISEEVSPDQDMATGDDDAMRHPGMQIN